MAPKKTIDSFFFFFFFLANHSDRIVKFTRFSYVLEKNMCGETFFFFSLYILSVTRLHDFIYTVYPCNIIPFAIVLLVSLCVVRDAGVPLETPSKEN